MPSRREFLLGIAALPFANLAKLAVTQATSRTKSAYITFTNSIYWQKAQGIDALKLSPVSPSLTKLEPEFKTHSMMTVVDDDGSNLKRLRLPGSYHTCFANPASGLLYVPGTNDSLNSLLLVFDLKTLDLVNVTRETDKPWRRYSGHGVVLPGSNHVAFGMWNSRDMGTYGDISIRDARTLKEVEVFSSGGFCLHDLRFSHDQKYFVCGHYGSYLGVGAYRTVAGNTGQVHWKHSGTSYYDAKMGAQPVYPASVTLVDVKSGKRFRRYSSTVAGPEGHADSDEQYRVFLPRESALLVSRNDTEENPRFKEGLQTEPDDGQFAFQADGYGVSIVYDPKFREVLIPERSHSMRMHVAGAGGLSHRVLDLASQLNWPAPQDDFFHGLELLPDGKHYVLSTSEGFIVVERGTHIVNRAMSFRTPLLIHSHLDVIARHSPS